MLSNHKRQLEKLQQSGSRAPAKVIDVHIKGSRRMDGFDMKHHPRSFWTDYKLDLRVMPEGQEPFETSVGTRWYDVVGGMWTGADVEVLFDPAKPHEVLVDCEGPVDRWEIAEQARIQAIREGR